jgi:hypothetical protein
LGEGGGGGGDRGVVLPSHAVTFCVAAVLLASALVAPQSARSNWTTNGTATGTPFTSSAGISLFRLYNATGTVAGWACANTTLSGILKGSGASGIGLATVTPGFGTCLVAGTPIPMQCGAASLNGLTYAAPTTFASISGITCVVWPTACGNATTLTGGITITGSMSATYGNTSQQLTVPVAGEALGATWPPSCMGSPASVSAQFFSPSGVAPVYGMTSTFRPQITN